MTLEDESLRSVGVQYATGEEWRNTSRKRAEPKWKPHSVTDVSGCESKIWCYEQYCIGTWNVRFMNQEARRQGVWGVTSDMYTCWWPCGVSSRVSVGTSGCCQSWVPGDHLATQIRCWGCWARLWSRSLKPSHKHIDLLEKIPLGVTTLNDVLSLHSLKTIYMIHLLVSQEYPRIEDLYHILLMTVSCEVGFLFLLFSSRVKLLESSLQETAGQ